MPDRPRTYSVLNILMKFHAFPSETMDKFCFVECLVPVGAGAPPNHHAGETESFYVIEGQIGFMIDGKEAIVGPGDHIAMPDGAVHAFQAVGEKPARLLIINAPGHMHEAFFTGVGHPLPEDQTELPEAMEPDIPSVLSMAERVGMTLVAPTETTA